MKLFKKLGIALAALALLTPVSLYALGSLGGSAFPLTYTTINPLNGVDEFNQLLTIINQQTVGISTLYANTLGEPSAGVDTSGVAFSTSPQGNPLVMDTYQDVAVSSGVNSTTMATIIASQAGRKIWPVGGGVSIMVSGTAATATAFALECSGGLLLAQWPIADLVTNLPIGTGLYLSTQGTITTGQAMTQGCPASQALMLSNVGALVTTTTHVYVNVPYTVQ